MKHTPHLFLPVWGDAPDLKPTDAQNRHLDKVLRISSGARVEYTDGAGRKGEGVWSGSTVERGDEFDVPRPLNLTMAIAPPSNRERQRFVVEKLAELGVARLLWIRTVRGKNHPPSEQKARAWAVSALEQSRGAWLLEVEPGLVDVGDLERPLAVCDASGVSDVAGVSTVAVGPEGGFDDDEIPADSTLLALGPTTLRVETAAIVAAGRLVY